MAYFSWMEVRRDMGFPYFRQKALTKETRRRRRCLLVGFHYIHYIHYMVVLLCGSTVYLLPTTSFLLNLDSPHALPTLRHKQTTYWMSNISSRDRERDSRVRRTLFWLNWLSSYGNSAAAENFKLKIFFLMWIGIMWLGWVSTSHIHVDFYLKKSPTSTEIKWCSEFVVAPVTQLRCIFSSFFRASVDWIYTLEARSFHTYWYEYSSHCPSVLL